MKINFILYGISNEQQTKDVLRDGLVGWMKENGQDLDYEFFSTPSIPYDLEPFNSTSGTRQRVKLSALERAGGDFEYHVFELRDYLNFDIWSHGQIDMFAKSFVIQDFSTAHYSVSSIPWKRIEIAVHEMAHGLLYKAKLWDRTHDTSFSNGSLLTEQFLRDIYATMKPIDTTPIFPFKGEYTFGYKYGVPTFYNDFHIGVDYILKDDKGIYAPEDGTVYKQYNMPQGGNTLILKNTPSGTLYRFLHLDRFTSVRDGAKALRGDILGYQGGTGVTTVPSVHLDVWEGGALKLGYARDFTTDPQKYFSSPSLPDGNEYNEDMQNLTWEDIDAIYLAVLNRPADNGARGYIGKDLLFTLEELGKSAELTIRNDLLKSAENYAK